MTDSDPEFTARVRTALEREVRGIRTETGDLWCQLQHRRLAERVKALAAAWHLTGDSGLLTPAAQLTGLLRERQNPGGLFRGGDNVDSPPDSAFSVNDLADAARLLREADDQSAQRLADRLVHLLDTMTPALVKGGVHTPNHRWELSAALARLHRLAPRPEIAARVGQWLAEGIDIEDGLYSERSANYAAAVSNPSLLVIADVFDRPDLLDAVEANLTATLDLLMPDGTVETVLSRRQDQTRRVPLREYLIPLRALAILRDRGDLAWAAGIALEQGVPAPANAVVMPLVNRRLPAPVAPAVPRQRLFAAAGTLVAHGPDSTAVVFGGSDYPRHRRIRSGLANSPTLLRLHAGATVLESVRLSRTFFGLGPFRAETLTLSPDTPADEAGPVVTLTETVSAAYYQPLPGDGTGRYALTDDGRFSAAMDFARRPRDEVSLTTRVRVALPQAGSHRCLSAAETAVEASSVLRSVPRVDLTVDIDGAAVDWALELAFRPGGTMTGARAIGGCRWHLESGTATYGGLHVTVVEASETASESDPGYHPGEDYAFLGGTDAADGVLLYVTGKAPSRLRLSITAPVV
ncbi:hypothetical protein [Actinoplanes xinjiangensis]|uniref:Heparinase II/III-like protein n=1 Tax=Actinoplanes xinjiangensis TaxID=512350 RepID=A0A316FCF2_9ACTN|nr:hypothetical protein [Actinoplanes xinjiangensis]PWK45169.1 hypothetical protein BC793_111143 [Actinoplanes xinjiangensis]GIF41496.1 hypothetical protein Axi01nite_58070 [Actinoplanes xinjiangensis]